MPDNTFGKGPVTMEQSRVIRTPWVTFPWNKLMEDNFKLLLATGKKPVLCEIAIDGKSYLVCYDGKRPVIEEFSGFEPDA